MANDMAIRPDYVSFAKECLANHSPDLRHNEAEWTVEAQRLVEVALESLGGGCSAEAFLSVKVSDGSSDSMAERIKDYIKDKALLFVRGYPRGCDFSALPE